MNPKRDTAVASERVLDEEVFAERLTARARKAGLELSTEQAVLSARHVKLMLEWNRRVNLTRITEPEEVITRHVLDALIPGLSLPQRGWALDVGTGPGFPGIPLKILHPDLQMVLLEANHKKVSFLKVVVAGLKLAGVTVLHGRWEDWDSLDVRLTRQEYGLITMRAVRMEKAHLDRLAARALGRGGLFAWWAGPEESSSLSFHTSDTGLALQGEIPYTPDPSLKPRRVVLWRKEA